MDVHVRGLHLPIPDPLTDHARHRLQLAVGRFEPRIRSVEVRLSDVNGPRGGVDKACQIEITLRHGGRVHAHAVDERVSDAIDRAAHRAARQLARRADRQASAHLH
jgi:ribosomal subunit interface protein